MGTAVCQSGRPLGDWMTTPSLWTSGFTINGQEQTGSDVSQFTRRKEFVMKILPAYLLSMILIESLCTAAFFTTKNIPAISTIAVATLKLQKKHKAAALITTNILTYSPE